MVTLGAEEASDMLVSEICWSVAEKAANQSLGDRVSCT